MKDVKRYEPLKKYHSHFIITVCHIFQPFHIQRSVKSLKYLVAMTTNYNFAPPNYACSLKNGKEKNI